MKSKKAVKGQYGYIRRQRVRAAVRTALMFALSLAIFGIGLYSTGKKNNLLTVVAILGCLPACKSAVNMIMFFKAPGCAEKVHEEIERHAEGLTGLYDMYFTSYEKSYPVNHLVVREHLVCGYLSDDRCDSAKCGKHLETMLKQGGVKNVTVKIYKDLEKYCDGLDRLRADRDRLSEGEQTQDILFNLLAVAL